MSEYTLDQEITLLKQDCALLKENITDLKRQFDNADDKRKQQIRQQSQEMAKELREAEARLNELLAQQEQHTDSSKQAPATLYNVPNLPSFMTEQPPLISEIKAKIVVRPGPSEVSNQQKKPIVLLAPSGAGKSLFASLVVRDDIVRRNFVSGIFWLSMSPNPDITGQQAWILKTLTQDEVIFTNEESGLQRLREYCSKRACLLVLDDVWDIRDVVAFSGLGQHCQLLITTCNEEVSSYAGHFLEGSKVHQIKSMPLQDAVSILQSVSDSDDEDGLKKVARAADYLPSNLQIIAGLQRTTGESWQDLLSEIQAVDCSDLDEAEMAVEHPKVLLQTLRHSVDSFGDESEYYVALAIFNNYLKIPQAAVWMLWDYLYHLSKEQARGFTQQLIDLALVKERQINDVTYLQLQVAAHDYICNEAELEQLNGHLLAAYKRQCGQHGWQNGPNDGYFFENLCVHLIEANRQAELKNLLLDFDWIKKRFSYNGISALLEDYTHLESDQCVQRVADALEKSAVTLKTNQDIEQLAKELLNHLWAKTSSEIQNLLNQTREIVPDWKPPH